MKSFLLTLLLIVSACGKGSSGGSSAPAILPDENQATPVTRDPMKEVVLVTPEGDKIVASMAYTASDKQKGLQNVRPENFSDSMGKLFIYFSDSTRTFWMPNTYFALDIIYLDENLVIKEIVWNLPSYSGNVDSEIPRAPAISSRHVLEMKAGSPISATLDVGERLKWSSSLSMEETLSRMKSSL